ncbi:MazG nucleotide pyrophosphohydrolase domain-containing protein, partial [Enterovirga sp.]|uniref:MazG nucleotide pyrophosphohydrolase domain-containing protein n=1 Tax=Enterovirga sp. TaxID=2026350 RepID=UPI002BA15169
KLTRKAAAVGFTWPDAVSVIDKVEEELAELREALADGNKDDIVEELGDLVFTFANLARQLDIDPEAALMATNRKFERRFRAVEAALRRLGKEPATSDLAEMDRLWVEAKEAEKAVGDAG